jgi:hypothetical protein
MKRIDESKFHKSEYCDEIVHKALVEITTGQSSLFAAFGGWRSE